VQPSELYPLVDRDVVARLAARIRRPAYVYFRRIMERQYQRALGVLPHGTRVHYAVKANPFAPVLHVFRSLGAGADVASLGELRAVLAAGFSPDDVAFSGPSKTELELRRAIRWAIGSINVESLEELETVIRLCRRHGERARLGLRVNPQTGGGGAALRMTGDTQFGIAERDLEEAIRLVRGGHDVISFSGLHAHLGSQLLQPEAIVNNFRTILAVAHRIEELLSAPLPCVNFGGGWGAPCFAGQSELDLDALREGLRALFGESGHRRLLAHARTVVELGRFLVAECGVYLTRVLYLKQGLHKRYAIVDGGMHHNAIAAGGMGQVLRRNFLFDLFSAAERHAPVAPLMVAGCLCTPIDVLGVDVPLPADLAAGDVLAILNSGAYGYTASPTLFLSHRPPTQCMQ